MDKFTISLQLPISATDLYNGWLNSEIHAAFTGGTAEIEPKVDEEYIAWDGYIWGKTLELVPHSRIVQSWRTAEFNDDDPDSKIVVEMEQVGGMSTLTLTHTNLQPGQGVKYEQGWEDSYFAPMRDYYTEKYQ